MATKRKYIVLIETFHSSTFDKFFDYIKYATCNYVAIDPEAFIIESYLGVRDLLDEFYSRSSSTKFFIAEITGEVTWRNATCGFNAMNNFLNSR